MSEAHTVSKDGIPSKAWEALKSLGLTDHQAYRAFQIATSVNWDFDVEWPSGPEYGFVRATHDEHGKPLVFPPAASKAWQWKTVGLVGHMLHKDTPMTMPEIKKELKKYGDDNLEGPYGSRDVVEAIVVLLEHNMATVCQLGESDDKVRSLPRGYPR